MSEAKYPEVNVELVGQDSNAFLMIGRVRMALKRGGVEADEVEVFSKEAMSGDYDHVLRTITNWVNVS